MEHKTKCCGEQQLQIAIPKQVENMHLPDPLLLTYYKNLDDRCIWVDDEITEHSLEYGRNIIEWNKQDRKYDIPIEQRMPIKIMFFSGGGCLNTTNALVDIIALSKTPIYGYNINMAYSGACIMFMKCHMRYALKQSTFLIHQGSTGSFGGDYHIVTAMIAEYERKIAEMYQFILDNTKISEEILTEKISTEWYLTAEEAIELGFCDKIIDNIDMLIGGVM